MELRHLIYFEAVARYQHFSRAAAELVIAQPALTRQIHDLERDLGGVALFERVGRNVRLTQAGHALLVHARQILAQVEAARREISALAESPRGRVTIGVPQTASMHILSEALIDFHQRFPELELRIQEGNAKTLLNLLEGGEVDVAVVTLPVSRRGLWITPVLTEELVIAVATAHRLAGRAGVALTELAGEPFLLYPQSYDMRELTLAACKRAGFAPRVALDGCEINVVGHLVQNGIGVALMPKRAAATQRLTTVRITDQSLQRTLALASRVEAGLANAVRPLRHFLAERLAAGSRLTQG